MKPLLYLFLTLLVLQINAQELCEGTLGDNIFIDGNFGNGTSNTLENDPGIAPGYNYANGVPNDGEYTITNDLGQLFPWETWIHATDNSDDEDGYFMVINASFEPGIFYEKVVSDLCPNTLYEFSADIINLIFEDIPDHILPIVSFLINGQVVYNTGEILQTETWNKYGFTFTTGENEQEITLTLRNSAPGGGGNDLGLDNISFFPCGPEVEIDLISDDTINCARNQNIIIEAEVSDEWNINWQTSKDSINWEYITESVNQKTLSYNDTAVGVKYFRYVTGSTIENTLNEKCFTISGVESLKVIAENYSYKDTICQGQSYEFGGSLINGAGFHSYGMGIGECDKIVHLELLVFQYARDVTNLTINQPLCKGDYGSIEISPLHGDVSDYNFTLYSDNNQIPLSNLTAGTYTLIRDGKIVCPDTTNITIVEPDIFEVNSISDTIILEGDKIELTTESNLNVSSLEWTPNDFLDCDNCLTPNAQPEFSTLFTVSAISENGCFADDQVLINVLKKEDYFIAVPNVFSPNNDGYNDYFILEYGGEEIINNISIEIYDRYGNLIFQNKDLQTKSLWDGHINGKPAVPGVYTYRINVQHKNERINNLFGSVLLVK